MLVLSTLQAKAGKLHRSDPLKVLHEESSDDKPSERPSLAADDDISMCASTAAESSPSGDGSQPGQRDTAMWWSYDSILSWPERMPHTESRLTSATSSHGRPPPGRPGGNSLLFSWREGGIQVLGSSEI